MGTWLGIIFWLLAVFSIWMTATALTILMGRRLFEEDAKNLYEQVMGSVRAGDLPRAILILEGEPGTLPVILSTILTEATKYTPKLRVAFKVTLESMKRKSLVMLNPLRITMMLAPILGLAGFISPLLALAYGNNPPWAHALLILLISVLVSGISYIILVFSERQERKKISMASEYGMELLSFLVSPESPLHAMRGRAFPPLS